MPVFQSKAQAAELFGELFRILATDPEFSGELERHGLTVALVHTKPDVTIYLAPGEVLVDEVPAPPVHLADNQLPAPVYEPAVAKLFADRAAIEVTEDAMSLMGARGYVREHRMEKYVRDALGTRIYEGTPEVLALAITEALYDDEEW